jgi:hypothetical protein
MHLSLGRSTLLVWLILAGCTEAVTVDTPPDLVASILADDKRLRFCVQRQFPGTDLHSLLSSQAIDLNGDKTPEFLIRTKVHSNCLCGNRSCAGWIYRATSGGYELLVEGSSDLRLARTSTNGFIDVIDGGRVYWDTWYRAVYRFDGTKYKLALCSQRDLLDWRYRPVNCDAAGHGA